MPVKMASSGGGQLSGQVVLVLQGGGALGAYQVGVYEALHEAGIEPQWVIGTSIGAINGAIIAGNPPDKRLERLTQFWDLVQLKQYGNLGAIWLSARLAYWMSFCRPITCQIDSGSCPVGCQTLTAKISASRRGLSSNTTSTGVLE